MVTQWLLRDTAAAVGASHDGRVATAVLGSPVVAAFGRHRFLYRAGTPKLAAETVTEKTCREHAELSK